MVFVAPTNLGRAADVILANEISAATCEVEANLRSESSLRAFIVPEN
jgi:hypothetical protein